MAPPSLGRDALFAVRLTPKERAMIRELAKVDGISDSDVVRMLVRREHASRFAERPKRKAAR